MNTQTQVKIFGLVSLVSLALSATLGAQQLLQQPAEPATTAHFKTLSVERLNVVEADGTVKLLLTNTERFPVTEEVNGRILNEDRKKRAGMLFFNEEGMEAGGFIFDGSRNEQGHSAGMSLTFDKYDGDQVMQLLTVDEQRGERRIVRSGLAFNDRPELETQQKVRDIQRELAQIEDRQLRRQKYMEYQQQGYLGGATRVLLGKTSQANNGLFLFASDGSPRAMFYVDEQDEVQLQFFNAAGEITHSWTAGAATEQAPQ
ncbi:MAG: hypothetical protein R3273_09100 [Pseudidiomarina maritima]|nr:hypothetical protein [Pseudidiomarina maritima]